MLLMTKFDSYSFHIYNAFLIQVTSMYSCNLHASLQKDSRGKKSRKETKITLHTLLVLITQFWPYITFKTSVTPSTRIGAGNQQFTYCSKAWCKLLMTVTWSGSSMLP